MKKNNNVVAKESDQPKRLETAELRKSYYEQKVHSLHRKLLAHKYGHTH